MALTSSINSKANIKQVSTQDLPVSPAYPVISSLQAVSTTNQTVINLGFSIQATGTQANTDVLQLFVDGKKLSLGSSNDYTFTSIGSDGTSSQVTLTQPLAANLNIYACKLGLKKEIEFQTDNRFTQAYEYLNDGFQGFINQGEFTITPTTTTGTPAAGTFYSSIVGRASITDLSQNLKAQMGVERFMTQQIYQIQNEFGPNGELVWGTPNDTFGQIRFVGPGWNTNNGTSGLLQLTDTSGTNYIEVVFYGTGLNLATSVGSVAATVVYSVDGGANSSNIWTGGTSYSGILNSRNYTPNNILSVVSGLALGIHTVQIKITSATILGFSGFEILNESSLVKVSSGVGYIQGKKYTSAALQSFSYSAPVTGSRGGRVVVYQNGDGTIGQAFQAVNASAASLGFAGTGYSGGQADHTNEEVVRSYEFREFGAGRSDDFSGNFSNGSNLSFTLDDGTTTLVGSGVGFATSNGIEGVYQNTTNNYITLTFIGTGLDIFTNGTGVTTTYTVVIDGLNVSLTYSVPTSISIAKIVSGLPYGEHTVKIIRNNANPGALFNKFIVYQPKKPSIPSGAIELADYHVAANYSARVSASAEAVSTGVIRKNASREFVYTGTWGIAQNSAAPGGFNVATSTNGSALQYSFFGTGFEIEAFMTTSTGTATLTIDGVSYTGAATALGAGSSYTTGTWTLGSTVGSALQISGLSLGLHTVVVTFSAATNGVNFNGFDLITPIHSVKSNIYADLQNTLPVGSCGISDNRKTTPVKDVLPVTKAWAQAVGISSVTTTSTSDVPMPYMSATVKTANSRLRIYFETNTQNTASANFAVFSIYLDGVLVGHSFFNAAGNNNGNTVIVTRELPVSAGTHKVDGYWRVSGGTQTAPNDSNWGSCLIVEEL